MPTVHMQYISSQLRIWDSVCFLITITHSLLFGVSLQIYHWRWLTGNGSMVLSIGYYSVVSLHFSSVPTHNLPFHLPFCNHKCMNRIFICLLLHISPSHFLLFVFAICNDTKIKDTNCFKPHSFCFSSSCVFHFVFV